MIIVTWQGVSESGRKKLKKSQWDLNSQPLDWHDDSAWQSQEWLNNVLHFDNPLRHSYGSWVLKFQAEACPYPVPVATMSQMQLSRNGRMNLVEVIKKMARSEVTVGKNKIRFQLLTVTFTFFVYWSHHAMNNRCVRFIFHSLYHGI